MAILTQGDVLAIESIPMEIRMRPDSSLRSSLHETRDDAEKARILKALEQTGWNISAAARMLNIERTNLHKRIRALGLKG
jgi:two-component system nitrogen regulation response regulator NtrX